MILFCNRCTVPFPVFDSASHFALYRAICRCKMALNSSIQAVQDLNQRYSSTTLMTMTDLDDRDSFGRNDIGKSFALQTTEQIELYGCLFLVPIGFILNTVSFVIFIVTKTHKTPTGLHLICIAVADNIVLILSFLLRNPNWIDYLEISVPLTTNFCRAIFFLVNFSIVWSGMLLASATIERFLSIAFTLQVKIWNLFRITKFLLIIYFAISITLGSILAYFTIVREFETETKCFRKEEHIEIYATLTRIIHTVFANGICSGTIFVFTVFIAVSIYSYKRKRNVLSEDGGKNSDQEFQITLMLFTVACLFIFTRIPEAVTFQVAMHCFANRIDSLMCHNMEVFWPLSTLLVLVNHSVNFFIYMYFFKSFRDCICKFYKTKRSAVPENSDSNTGSTFAVGTEVTKAEYTGEILESVEIKRHV